ncbi:flagellar basal-body rod protein FlgF [Prosthecomicrobium sp. N25]|uniref:flagellar basal-body rod protein FlgF n=1 Tax=Prosthecomicrobium sp. N25 TaxID=3129254 RepID=UPI00307840AC
MENAQLVGLSRQVTLQRQMDLIANNLANINTNGFKAQSLLFEEIGQPRAAANTFLRPDQPISFVVDDANLYDMQPGQMTATGNPTDVALDGRGWFVVQTPQGERYTRNGSFAVNAQGQLVTRDNDAVLTDGGPLTLQPGETNLSIASDGTISTNQGVKGKLRVVDFERQGSLKKVGETLFEGENPIPATLPRVVQGQIEKSNVRGVVELSRMIAVQRSYESVAKWMQNADDLRRSAIEKLGQVS